MGVRLTIIKRASLWLIAGTMAVALCGALRPARAQTAVICLSGKVGSTNSSPQCPEAASAGAAAPILHSSVDDVDRLKLDGLATQNVLPWQLPGSAESSPADETSGLPVAVNPTASGFTARASSKTWRENADKNFAKQMNGAKNGDAKDVKLPAAPRYLEPPVEIWSSLSVQDSSSVSPEQSLRTGAGANYKFSPSTTFGVSAERGEVKASPDANAAGDDNVSAFMNFKAAPMLSFDAKTNWQSSRPPGSPGSTLERSDKGSLIVSPRVSHTFVLKNGQTVEPFINYKREFDVVTTGSATTGSGTSDTQSAGTGITFAKPNSYSVGLTTDVEGLDHGAEKSVNGKLQIKLPLP